MDFLPSVGVAALLFVLIAIGDIISTRTRARVPAILVAIILYLTLVWTGVVDGSVVSASVVNQFGVMVIAMALVHLGTIIPIKVLTAQWRAVLIAVSGLVVALTLILTIVSLVYDYPTAVSGSGPIAGGILAMLITSQELEAQGLSHLMVIPATIIAIQGLVGIPIASALLRRYAVSFRARSPLVAVHSPGSENLAHTVDDLPVGELPEDVPEEEFLEETHRQLLPQRYRSPAVLLAMVAGLGTFAFYLGDWTGVNYGIWSLLIGIACQYFGVLPHKALDEANSFGIVTAGILVVVLASMGGVTISQLLDSIGPVLLILALGVIGLLAGGMLAARLLKWDPKKAMPVSLTALIGFPADYIICEEIANSLGEDAEEREAIMDEILAPMLVGGFTSVSLASVLIASTLVGTL